MTIAEIQKAQSVIRAIAAQYHKKPEDVRQSIQEALDAAYAAAWQPGNIHAQVNWQRLFGPRKPSPEEALIKLAQAIRTTK